MEERTLEPRSRVGRELIYSSGTTGQPKGVKRELAFTSDVLAMPALEQRICTLFEFDAATIYLSVSPLYHATGRFAMRITETGGTVVIIPNFDPAAALAAIEAQRVTHSQWVYRKSNRLNPSQ